MNNVKSIFNEALANLDLLDEHNLPDDQPHIEGKDSLLSFNVSLDNDFCDILMYSNITNKYCEECSYMNDLIQIINEGKEFCVMLYTWRCCSRAIPQPKSNEQPNRVEIYEKTVEVLAPEVNKLLKFMYFCRKAIESFVNEIRRVCSCEKRRPFLNDSYLLTLGKILEMFMNLDELKNMKSSIKNDYSAYRRAAQFLKVMHNSEALQESQNLSMFLANQNKIRMTLKANLESVDYFEDIFYEIIKSCLNAYEKGFFVTPAEKHLLIKVISFSINLLDSDRHNIYNPKHSAHSNNRLGHLNLNSLDLSISSTLKSSKMLSGSQAHTTKSRNGSSTLNSLSLIDTRSGPGKKKNDLKSYNSSFSGGSAPAHLAPLPFTKLDKILGYGPKFMPIYIAGQDVGSLLVSANYIRFATDMQICPFTSYITKTPNYDSSKWPVSSCPTPQGPTSRSPIGSQPKNDGIGRNQELLGTVDIDNTTEPSHQCETSMGLANVHCDMGTSMDNTLMDGNKRSRKISRHPLLSQIPQNLALNNATNEALSGSGNISKKCENISVGSLFNALNSFFVSSNHSTHRQFCKTLLTELTLAREMYTSYAYQLSIHINEASLCQNQRNLTDAQNKEIKDLALKGLLLLAHWNCVISETHSSKLMNPTDSNKNKDCPPNAEDYERAIKFNYSSDEKSALIEMITLVKSLQSLLSKANPLFRESIMRNVYAELQDLVQLNVREALRKAIKNKKESIKNILLAVRETCMEVPLNYDFSDDPMYKGKKDNHQDSNFEVTVPRKAIPPSHTQLYIVRALFEMLVSDNYPPGTKKSLKKDLDSNTVSAVENFLKNSYFWGHLLNFNDVMAQCSDLAYFWYREFYLEMTMGKRVQFPIDMSGPWILINCILRSKKPASIESLFYVLDLYNDSAQFSLEHLKKRHLYDEIEAEVNLCFDQLVYQLSEQIFSYHKQLASCILLDKRFNEEFSAYGNRITFPPSHRYHVLLKQRHIQLLGRWVDLNRLLNQRIYLCFKKSLRIAISTLESNDITGIIEFDTLIEINKLAYNSLSRYLILPDFDDILSEVNRQNTDTNYTNFEGIEADIVTNHVLCELFNDFLVNYCYNSTTNRFVKTKEINFSPCNFARKKPSQIPSQAYLWGSKALNSAYNYIFYPYKSFLGTIHVKLLCTYLGYRGLALVFQELLKRIKDLMTGELLEHVTALMRLMPKQSKLLRYDYGSAGILAYYQAQLKEILKYPNLKTGTFQLFREIGNCLLFALCLEKNLFEEETIDLLQASIFQNVIPRPYCPEGEKIEQKLKLLESKCNALNIAINVENFGSAKQTHIAKESDLLTKERLCCGLSLFQTMLLKICRFFQDAKTDDGINVWTGSEPLNTRFDTCTEFHRLWSALQFVYCLPLGENEFTIEQLYGESINLAGCAFIYLLNQQNRFETLDFSYHLLKVQRVDNREDKKNGVNLKRMADRIRKFQVLNSQIFSTLGRYLDQPTLRNAYEEGRNDSESNADGQDKPPSRDNDPLWDNGDHASSTMIEHIKFFSPPIHELALQNMI